MNGARTTACLLLLAALGIGHPAEASLVILPGDILLADSGPPGRLIRIDPVSGTSTILALLGFLSRPNDVVVEASGNILIADQNAFGGPGGVIRIDHCTGSQSAVSFGSPFSDPFGIAIDPSGRIVIGDRGGSGALPPDGLVILVDPTQPPATNKTIVSAGGLFVDPEGVAVGNDGGLFFLAADINALGGPGAIIKVDPVTGSQTVIAGGLPFASPRDVEIAPNGDLIVADLNAGPGSQGAVFRVDPVAGSISFVSFGQLFTDPSGVVIEPDGKILVADVGPFGGTGSIIRVDPSLPPSANQTLVATGFPLVDPADLVLYPTSQAGAPPVCAAGGPYRAECAGSTTAVFLNASASSDLDGDSLVYAWSSDCPGASFSDATSATPLLFLNTSGGPVSCHVTLCVSDCTSSTCCDATVEILDTTGPEFVQQAPSGVLWPPDHRYVTIGAGDALAAVQDACDGPIDLSDVQVTSVTCDEAEDADADGHTLEDIVIVCPNTVMLRAERQGTSNGRVYSIHYAATDGSGNTSTTTRTVLVPHDQPGPPAIEGPGSGYTVNTCGPPLGKAGMGGPVPVGVRLVGDSHRGRGVAFSMKEAGAVRLDVYDIRGRLVQSLHSEAPAGAQSIYWNGLDAAGRRAATGIYLFKLHARDLNYSAKVAWMN